jgi:hypothetical protein
VVAAVVTVPVAVVAVEECLTLPNRVNNLYICKWALIL